MKIKQFTTELDKIFTLKQAEDFDNVENFVLCHKNYDFLNSIF